MVRKKLERYGARKGHRLASVFHWRMFMDLRIRIFLYPRWGTVTRLAGWSNCGLCANDATRASLYVCHRVSNMASPLENLETQLELFIENVRQIRIIVSDFQPQGQNVLNQKIQGLVSGLQEIDKLKSQVQDVHVPLEVFDYIDQGRNPQLYTKDCIEKALTKNEQVKGKIDAYRKFKANMLVELTRVFPHELAKYRAIRGDE